MLGMMNSPSDGVEFYAVRQTPETSTMSEADRNTFTNAKKKDDVTYTKDGRKVINGKLEETTTAPTLWGQALFRGVVKTQILQGEGEVADEETIEPTKPLEVAASKE